MESFAHALRAEVAHRRVGVGIAYINWTDTDMVRDADEHAVLRELRGHMPSPARKVFPAPYVAGRLVSTIERRRAAVYVPRWLRSTQFVRAAMPPVVTWLSRRELPRLAAAEPFSATGLLGAGGRADQAAHQGVRPVERSATRRGRAGPGGHRAPSGEVARTGSPRLLPPRVARVPAPVGGVACTGAGDGRGPPPPGGVISAPGASDPVSPAKRGVPGTRSRTTAYHCARSDTMTVAVVLFTSDLRLRDHPHCTPR
ncbi:hypothetical protein SHKM778_27720 [Streptomyces sp. KM77-8]|uniref:Uncharacterized protein n=1 Tax=Streptomyces haneummycinicus TaxID=3074435 RepID=A0AAT9HG50_9ACTN